MLYLACIAFTSLWRRVIAGCTCTAEITFAVSPVQDPFRMLERGQWTWGSTVETFVYLVCVYRSCLYGRFQLWFQVWCGSRCGCVCFVCGVDCTSQINPPRMYYQCPALQRRCGLRVLRTGACVYASRTHVCKIEFFPSKTQGRVFYVM
jgi:hypothetical protein